MAEWVKKISPKAAELWEKLSPGRRMAFLAGVALLIGSLILITSIVQKGNFSPLFTDLDSRDAGEIIEALKEDKIPYRLTDGGSTILVPEDLVYETRLKLASAGMPRGGTVGFELFNQSSLGTTDFERKLKYNWALQGELTRTIREMREVEDARVHIVLPEKSLFIEEETPATASVLLKLRPYARLSKGQVRGIANLVAYAVEGLKPENVTILDTNGNILSDSVRFDPEVPVSGDLIAAQFELKERTEEQLEKSVKTMLDRVFGFGKAVVRVNADLNFEYKESEAERYLPVVDDTGLLRSEQEYIEEYTGAPSGAIGVPGITSNIPTYETTDSGESSQYTKKDVTRNYELNRVNERVVTPPGSINRLTVAVWLDGELSSEQLDQVRAAVQSAVGFSADRGDQVTIETMNFEEPEALQFEEEPVPANTGVEVAKYLPYAAALLLAIAGVAFMMRR
ncbi:MAG: flagellar M-ring protein FliF, partial [Firmicutes bacterium]|nr:flagellar M-ring protein FliF [Bacillota bacterium]